MFFKTRAFSAGGVVGNGIVAHATTSSHQIYIIYDYHHSFCDTRRHDYDILDAFEEIMHRGKTPFIKNSTAVELSTQNTFPSLLGSRHGVQRSVDPVDTCGHLLGRKGWVTFFLHGLGTQPACLRCAFKE